MAKLPQKIESDLTSKDIVIPENNKHMIAMWNLISPKERKFIKNYLETFDFEQACVKAGYEIEKKDVNKTLIWKNCSPIINFILTQNDYIHALQNEQSITQKILNLEKEQENFQQKHQAIKLLAEFVSFSNKNKGEKGTVELNRTNADGSDDKIIISFNK